MILESFELIEKIKSSLAVESDVVLKTERNNLVIIARMKYKDKYVYCESCLSYELMQNMQNLCKTSADNIIKDIAKRISIEYLKQADNG